MKNNIVLVGMPGSGKSHICKKLSEILTNYIAYDTDSIIEKTTGLKIADIFQQYSEDYFRKLEYDTIKLICTGNSKIISVGGGAFENPDNRMTLLSFGKVFYLKSDLDVLYYRISKENSRPLLNCNNPREVLENILKKRESNYQKAHCTIDTNTMDESQIVEYIIGSMNEADSSC